MPTYLILLIGRLLAIGNLDFRNLRLLLAGRPFTLRADAILPKGHQTPIPHKLNPDPLDLIERDFVAGSVIELGRSRRLMICDRLRRLQRAAFEQVRRDSCPFGDPACIEKKLGTVDEVSSSCSFGFQ